MNPSRNITYYCQQCSFPTSTLHEVIFGTAFRKIAVNFSVQTPLCSKCHQLAHRHKEEYQRIFLDWLGLDYYTTIRAFNTKSLRSYLEIHKDQCEEKIRSLEV